MLKHFIKYQIKNWWPLALIFSLAMSLVTMLESLMADTSYRYFHPGEGAGYGMGASAPTSTLTLLIIGLLVSVMMSLFVFTYRTKKQSVDVFYQAAYSPTTLKRVRVFIGLAIVIISITVAFLVGFTIYALRYAATPEVAQGQTVDRIRLDLDLGGYVLGYVLVLVTVVAQYFINCFLVSLGDYTLDQLFLLVFGNLLLILFFTGPTGYVLFLLSANNIHVDNNVSSIVVYGFGPVGAFATSSSIIQRIVNKTPINMGLEEGNAIGATVLHIVFGAACAIFNCFMPDPSGEHADVAGPRNKYIALIPHGGALALGFLVSIVGALFSPSTQTVLPYFVYLLYGVAYYSLLSLWRHSFKPSKLDLICFLSVFGSILVLMVISTVCTNGYGITI